MKPKTPSPSVIKRLPRYHRTLYSFKKKGLDRISSSELAQTMGLTASQIRQDLNCFGGFGQQGYGYNIDSLIDEISRILKIDTTQKAVLIGAGYLGHTISNYLDFNQCGFELVGIFDNSNSVVGSTMADITIKHIDELLDFCKEHNPTMVVLTVPTAALKQLKPLIIECNFKGVWDFTLGDLNLDNEGIFVKNTRLSDSLKTIRYYI